MVAVMFPGQGSQKPGMGQDLFLHYTKAKQVFESVSDATGIDVASLCFESDEETLRQTQNAQLSLYTSGLAAWFSLIDSMPELNPGMMAGHSVGEYTALAAAGILSIEEGAKLVQYRGEIMAKAGSSRPGTMAAVLAMDNDSLQKALDSASDAGAVVIANDNCPGQLVISGDINAVQKASGLAMDCGARKVVPLNVSGAFHSPLMDESAELMGKKLAEATFNDSEISVYSNVLAKPGSDWPALLKQQLKDTVQWAETVRNMITDGATQFVECGSGDVLCGLLRRIDRDKKGIVVVDSATLDEAKKKLGEVN